MEDSSMPTTRVQYWQAVGAVLESSLLVDWSRGGGVAVGGGGEVEVGEWGRQHEDSHLVPFICR